MTISLRFTKPCARCRQPAACATVKRELEFMVERLHWYSEAHQIQMPDAEIVFDCRWYDPMRIAVSGHGDG